MKKKKIELVEEIYYEHTREAGVAEMTYRTRLRSIEEQERIAAMLAVHAEPLEGYELPGMFPWQ